MARERVPGTNFDSHLVTRHISASRNAELILRMRVYLERVPPHSTVTTPRSSDGSPMMGMRTSRTAARSYRDSVDGATDLISPWTDQEWTTWRASVERVVQDAFNGPNSAGRFWLVPRSDTTGEPCYWGVGEPSSTGVVQVPNVKCLFDIQLLQSAGNAQRVVQCIHYAPNARGVLRPFMSPDGTGMLHDRTTRNQAMRGGTWQVAAVHEFFHALGMHHVNSPRSIGDALVRFFTEGWAPNSSAEYGVTPRSRSNIMGAGNNLEGWNFWPWVNRLQAHLDEAFTVPAVQWDVVSQRPRPRPVTLSYDGSMHRDPGLRR